MNSFEKAFYKGFKLSNCEDSIDLIKEKILIHKFVLQKKENDNFFFLNVTDGLLYYFINDLKNYNLSNNCVKILAKADNQLLLHNDFLKLNNFKEISKHQQMVLKKENTKPYSFSFISQPCVDDAEEIYYFFKKYFDQYLFYFSKQTIKEKINNIFIYKEQQKIHGALIYTQTLSSYFLDFIAVDQNLKYKNIAFALLNHYFLVNQKSKFFKLFVEESNKKAIKFYKRSGFNFNSIILNFYRNF
ncbi:GNAT family N-acetyltransferase [Campylobacter sp. RM9756]|uniref:GNAT family N-acetyltransferase n=1 Tax=Campylobacter molothri TaxID=1032242 RepID=UPI001DAEE075|nr:GNAT family N-acetyltransferase [Campylobacter sp. RM9756]